MLAHLTRSHINPEYGNLMLSKVCVYKSQFKVYVGEGAIKLGRVGAPPHEVMIKLINRRQFTVRVMRIFVINPQELMKSSTNFIIHLMVVENQKRTRSRVLF